MGDGGQSKEALRESELPRASKFSPMYGNSDEQASRQHLSTANIGGCVACRSILLSLFEAQRHPQYETLEGLADALQERVASVWRDFRLRRTVNFARCGADMPHLLSMAWHTRGRDFYSRLRKLKRPAHNTTPIVVPAAPNLTSETTPESAAAEATSQTYSPRHKYLLRSKGAHGPRGRHVGQESSGSTQHAQPALTMSPTAPTAKGARPVTSQPRYLLRSQRKVGLRSEQDSVSDAAHPASGAPVASSASASRRPRGDAAKTGREGASNVGNVGVAASASASSGPASRGHQRDAAHTGCEDGVAASVPAHSEPASRKHRRDAAHTGCDDRYSTATRSASSTSRRSRGDTGLMQSNPRALEPLEQQASPEQAMAKLGRGRRGATVRLKPDAP